MASDRDKEAVRLIRIAYKAGAKVPFSMRYMMDLRVSLKVIKAVLNNSSQQ